VVGEQGLDDFREGIGRVSAMSRSARMALSRSATIQPTM
jgi:hypothetical protein